MRMSVMYYSHGVLARPIGWEWVWCITHMESLEGWHKVDTSRILHWLGHFWWGCWLGVIVYGGIFTQFKTLSIFRHSIIHCMKLSGLEITGSHQHDHSLWCRWDWPQWPSQKLQFGLGHFWCPSKIFPFCAVIKITCPKKSNHLPWT